MKDLQALLASQRLGLLGITQLETILLNASVIVGFLFRLLLDARVFFLAELAKFGECVGSLMAHFGSAAFKLGNQLQRVFSAEVKESAIGR